MVEEREIEAQEKKKLQKQDELARKSAIMTDLTACALRQKFDTVSDKQKLSEILDSIRQDVLVEKSVEIANNIGVPIHNYYTIFRDLFQNTKSRQVLINKLAGDIEFTPLEHKYIGSVEIEFAQSPDIEYFADPTSANSQILSMKRPSAMDQAVFPSPKRLTIDIPGPEQNPASMANPETDGPSSDHSVFQVPDQDGLKETESGNNPPFRQIQKLPLINTLLRRPGTPMVEPQSNSKILGNSSVT